MKAPPPEAALWVCVVAAAGLAMFSGCAWRKKQVPLTLYAFGLVGLFFGKAPDVCVRSGPCLISGYEKSLQEPEEEKLVCRDEATLWVGSQGDGLHIVLSHHGRQYHDRLTKKDLTCCGTMYFTLNHCRLDCLSSNQSLGQRHWNPYHSENSSCFNAKSMRLIKP